MSDHVFLPKAARAAVFLICVAATAAKVDPVNKAGGGVAVKGADVVAYFEQGRLVKGSRAFAHQWMNATWLFSSAENRDRFAADPQRYAPQYGGYCSYAVSQGYTASIDPEAWRIVNGKLYLNYSKSVQKKWEQDTEGYIRKADQNWPGLHR